MSLYTKEVDSFSEETKAISKQWFKKFAVSYPAYQFITNYAKIMVESNENTPEGFFGRRFAQILSMESDRDVNNELRLVEIEKDLIELVENTDNKIFYRNLFFPSIFINNDFIFEGLVIKGIYITECYSEPGQIIILYIGLFLMIMLFLLWRLILKLVANFILVLLWLIKP